MMKTASRMLQDFEYSWSVVVNGKRVAPRYAFHNRHDWYSHLLTLEHNGITEAINILRNIVRT